MTPTEKVNLATAIGTGLAGLAALGSIVATIRIAATQRTLAQRQLLLPLWQYLSTLEDINPLKPVTPAVVKTVNTLELVAICCEGGMVDAAVIRRTFRDGFMRHYEAIENCVQLPGLNKSGKELLSENRAAQTMFAKLRAEHLDQDRLRKLGG